MKMKIYIYLSIITNTDLQGKTIHILKLHPY